MSDSLKRKLIYIAVLAVAFYSVWTSNGSSNEAQHAAQVSTANSVALHSGLVRGCQENGNPLRRVVGDLEHVLRHQVISQIAQNQSFLKSGAYETFFPSIPPARLKTLIDNENRRQLAEVKSLDKAVSGATERVNCRVQYSLNR